MSQERPLVSILVPVYNVSKYLRECLDSLVNQTLSNIEIVCVNDGSTDESPSILAEYSSKDDRIHVVTKKNGGLPSARNAGLDVAKGQYVAFVDGDDFVDLDMFHIMYDKAVSTNAEIVVCGGKVYPEDDTAPGWLTDALSPYDEVIKNVTAEVLFSKTGIRPFIWRYMISKDLIDRNNFRLDESIVVGEDQAFQFKVIPAAKKMAIISDKLYNYRWSRPDSIMNASEFKDYGNRVSKHVRMLKGIFDSWNGYAVEDSTKVRLFEWAVDFIYWDFIRVSQYDRKGIAAELVQVLVNNGYYSFQSKYEASTRDHFEYIAKAAKVSVDRPRVSAVIVFGANESYLKGAIASVLQQDFQDLELILYANNPSESAMNVVWAVLKQDYRVCVRLGEWQPLSEKYNDAIITAKGDWIVFLSEFDRYSRTDWFREIIQHSDEQVDLIGYVNGKAGPVPIEACQLCKYRQFAYRVSVIRENNIMFEDYALFIGSVFFSKNCMVSKIIVGVRPLMIQDVALRRTSIYLDEAKLTLRAMAWLIDFARSNGLDLLGLRITSLLNSENYTRLFTDATSDTHLEWTSTDSSEDYHAEILSLLIELNTKRWDDGDNSMLKTLSSFIANRHKMMERL